MSICGVFVGKSKVEITKCRKMAKGWTAKGLDACTGLFDAAGKLLHVKTENRLAQCSSFTFQRNEAIYDAGARVPYSLVWHRRVAFNIRVNKEFMI